MTKRKILLLLVSMAASAALFSQDVKKTSTYRKAVFGLKCGTNFSWFQADSKNLDKGGLKLGFVYGIMGDFNFSENYAFAFEFLVSNLNGKMKFKEPMTYWNKKAVDKDKDTLTAERVGYAYTNKYIQIPVSLKFRTKEIGYMKYVAQFGLAPAIRIGSKTKIDGVNLPWNEDDRKGIKTNNDAEEEFEPIDNSFSDDVSFIHIPLMIGLGFEYNLSGNTSTYVNVRYENGFTNILKSSGTKVFGKNIAVSIGVFF